MFKEIGKIALAVIAAQIIIAQAKKYLPGASAILG